MFENFFHQGSVVSIVLMAYAGNVMIEALRRDRLDRSGVNTPLIIKSSIGTLFIIGSIPCAIWPAIYVGLFDGWVAGILAWLILQILGAVITITLGIRGWAIGLHFIAACIAYPIGYFLSISNLVA